MRTPEDAVCLGGKQMSGMTDDKIYCDSSFLLMRWWCERNERQNGSPQTSNNIPPNIFSVHYGSIFFFSGSYFGKKTVFYVFPVLIDNWGKWHKAKYQHMIHYQSRKPIQVCFFNVCSLYSVHSKMTFWEGSCYLFQSLLWPGTVTNPLSSFPVVQ